MTKAIDLKKGNIITIPSQGKAFLSVVSTEHQKPGKGGAYIQAELKNLKTGNKINFRFRSDESVDVYEHYNKKASFSYSDADFFYFLLKETFEEVQISKNNFSENFKKMISDEMELDVYFIDDEIVDVKLPDKFHFKVKRVDPPTKRASMKPATLENDLTVMVPDFIVDQDEILIRTETLEYLERYKD